MWKCESTTKHSQHWQCIVLWTQHVLYNRSLTRTLTSINGVGTRSPGEFCAGWGSTLSRQVWTLCASKHIQSGSKHPRAWWSGTLLLLMHNTVTHIHMQCAFKVFRFTFEMFDSFWVLAELVWSVHHLIIQSILNVVYQLTLQSAAPSIDGIVEWICGFVLLLHSPLTARK